MPIKHTIPTHKRPSLENLKKLSELKGITLGKMLRNKQYVLTPDECYEVITIETTVDSLVLSPLDSVEKSRELFEEWIINIKLSKKNGK